MRKGQKPWYRIYLCQLYFFSLSLHNATFSSLCSALSFDIFNYSSLFHSRYRLCLSYFLPFLSLQTNEQDLCCWQEAHILIYFECGKNAKKDSNDNRDEEKKTHHQKYNRKITFERLNEARCYVNGMQKQNTKRLKIHLLQPWLWSSVRYLFFRLSAA